MSPGLVVGLVKFLNPEPSLGFWVYCLTQGLRLLGFGLLSSVPPGPMFLRQAGLENPISLLSLCQAV